MDAVWVCLMLFTFKQISNVQVSSLLDLIIKTELDGSLNFVFQNPNVVLVFHKI